MLIGTHVLIYAKDADKARRFFRDVLGFPHVNAGHGWLIFTLPPSEVGFHPAEDGPERHVMYLICDDLARTVAELAAKGVACSAVHEAEWGSLVQFEVPGAGTFGVYQPKHPLAIKARGRAQKPAARPGRVKKRGGNGRQKRRSPR